MKVTIGKVTVSYDGHFVYVRNQSGKLLRSIPVQSRDTWRYREPVEVFEAVVNNLMEVL